MLTRRVVISGRVQGVGYRSWTIRQAKKLKLDGWVRNLGDGSVEAVFSGAESIIEEMLVRCGKGPIAARVDTIMPHPYTDPVQVGFYQKSTL